MTVNVDVDDAYKNTAFRFIKMQMIDPQPDVLHDMVHEFA